MKTNNNKYDSTGPDDLAQQVHRLAEDIKLQSINLAIMLAKAKKEQRGLRELDPQFGELISTINKTARRIDDILKAFQGSKKMICSLPASSEIIARRGAYDEIEATLNYIFELSQDLIGTINEVKQQEPIN